MINIPKPQYEKTESGLLMPHCWQAKEIIDKVKPRTILSGEFTKPRSLPYHNRFFKIISLVAKYDIEKFRSEKVLYDGLKLSLGYIEHIPNPIGKGWLIIEKSNAFYKTDQFAFEQFVEGCFDILHGILGFRPETLLDFHEPMRRAA